MFFSVVLFWFVFVLCVDFIAVLNNGLARTPPMGWMSWGYYMCSVDCENTPEKCLNEELILSVADAFYKDGYLETGYEYIIIDDCWSEMKRDLNGRLVPDKKRFPNGMKYLADYIHARGLKFGMYTTVGADTCMRYPGSGGHFALDAKTFAEWEVDYLKVDGCFVEDEFLEPAYIKLGYYINKTGRPMVFSCSWPYYNLLMHSTKPKYKKVAKHCNLWRNYHDVFPNWKSVSNIIKFYTLHIEEFMQYNKPGQWNDPDMLLLGTDSLTYGQLRIQFTLYALWSAPLLLSCDMTKIKPFEAQLAKNLDLIAIAQDPLGIMAIPHSLAPELTLWMKRHVPVKGNRYHSYSFALVNFADKIGTGSFTPETYGLDSNDDYTVLEVLTGVFLKNVTRRDSINVTVPPQDVVLYTLYPL